MLGSDVWGRKDLAILLLTWIRPLKKYYSAGYAQLLLGETSAPYGRRDVYLEGFARLLWGVAPLLSQSNHSLPSPYREEVMEWTHITQKGLIHGTDPEHPEFWGVCKDKDHKFVEMAAIAYALLLAPDVYWKPLSEQQKSNVYNWLNQINGKIIDGNNWIAFRILVNVLFSRLGFFQWNEQLQRDIEVFEKNYEGDGWYHDGNVNQKDYYISFAMHFYGLLFSRFLNQQIPAYCSELQERARKFYDDYRYWFDDFGRSVPFGRSLTYRFAHSAAFSAMAFTSTDVPQGELKYIIGCNLDDWSKQSIFDRDGILTIGYRYPNLIMSEMYNSPTSPYWALKTFLLLALPETDQFWKCTPKKPTYTQKKCLIHPNMLAIHEKNGQALLFPAGQYAPEVGNADAKYQKFVYSSEFGFSISRGNTLAAGAFDNTLAATKLGDDFWRVRRKCIRYEVTGDTVKMLYEIMPEVYIESSIIPVAGGHIRIHEILSGIKIELADGGFAIAKECADIPMDGNMIREEHNAVRCDFPWGNAGAVSFSNGKAELITPFPNTNLMHSTTVIPTIRYVISNGRSRVVDFFYASAQNRDFTQIPEIHISAKGVIVAIGNEELCVETGGWLTDLKYSLG